MNGWIRTTLPLIVAAIIGALVTIGLPKIIEPAKSSMDPSVSFNRVEVPTFSRLLEKGDYELLAPIAARFSGIGKQVLRVLLDVDRNTHVNLFEITILNSTTRRTKNLEVAFDRAIFVVVAGDQPNKSEDRFIETSKSHSVQINPLDPGTTATIIVASTATDIGWGSTVPVRTLVDDRLVEMQPLRIAPTDTILLWAARNWPDGSLFLQLAIWGAIVLVVLYIAFLLFAIFARNNFALLAKLHTRSDRQRAIKFAEYLKQQFPDTTDKT